MELEQLQVLILFAGACVALIFLVDVARGSEEMQADEEQEEGEGSESASSTEQFSGRKQEQQTSKAARR